MKRLVLCLLLVGAPALAQQPKDAKRYQEADHLIATQPEPAVREFIRSLEDSDFGSAQPEPDVKLDKPDLSLPSCPADATREYASANKCRLLHGVMGGKRVTAAPH
jgi:hypothetical protein